MDGVLVDTGDVHFRSWNATLSKYSLPFDYETFRTAFGMNNEGIVRMLLGDQFHEDLYLEISNKKEETFREAIKGELQLLPGVFSLLKDIQELNIPQAIGSSAPQENIDVIVEELDLGSYFQAQVSAFGIPGKPDPAVFLICAQRLNVLPENCLVIEDAISGVEAALHAGMRCVAVTTTNPASDLISADLVVESLETIKVDDLIALMD